jgi:hypothetical protein
MCGPMGAEPVALATDGSARPCRNEIATISEGPSHEHHGYCYTANDLGLPMEPARVSREGLAERSSARAALGMHAYGDTQAGFGERMRDMPVLGIREATMELTASKGEAIANAFRR